VVTGSSGCCRRYSHHLAREHRSNTTLALLYSKCTFLDPRSHTTTRRNSWKGFQHKIRQLQTGRLRWRAIRLKSPIAYRKRLPAHPKAHAGAMDTRSTTSDPDPLSGRYSLHHFTSQYQER